MSATGAVQVDPTNADQLRAWDGDEGAFWATHAGHFDRSVAAYHEALLRAAAIGTGDHVLDVGCGTGQVTRDAARSAVAGHALGVDLSGAMLDVARQKADAEGLANVAFEQADAQIHPFAPGAFDLVVSRTAAMFFGDKPAAFRNLATALRPGGRLVLVTWQSPAENEWLREFSGAMAPPSPGPAPAPTPPADGPGPFSLSDPARIRDLLSNAGFVDVRVEGASAPMWFGEDADDAFALVFGLLGWMVEGRDDDGRRRAMDALRATIDAHVTADGVRYGSGAWTTTAVRSTSSV